MSVNTTIANFDPEVYQYDSVLAYGTTVAPEVSGTLNDINVDTTTIQATELPGAATVKIIAEDGTTKLTYKVNFTLALSNIATLSTLEYVASGDAYEILGPVTDANADTVTTQATTLPGSATVKVMDEDGNEKTISFFIEAR